MYTMILSKSKDVKQIRDIFNMIYTKVKQRGSNLDKQMSIGKKRRHPAPTEEPAPKKPAPTRKPARVAGVTWNKKFQGNGKYG